MRFTLASLVALTGMASATLEPRACDGKGACVSVSGCNYVHPTVASTDEAACTCGTAGTVTVQQAASLVLSFRQGLTNNFTSVSKADFPKYDIVEPGTNSVLLSTEKDGITAFAFIDFNCSGASPGSGSCYVGDRDMNSGSITMCKVVRSGTACQTTNTRVSSCNTN